MDRYITPTAKVVYINAQDMLCASTSNTEKFEKSSYSYDDDAWE